MKRYTIIDNDKKESYSYSKLEWNLAWFVVGVIGFVVGLFYGYCI